MFSFANTYMLHNYMQLARLACLTVSLNLATAGRNILVGQENSIRMVLGSIVMGP